MTLQLIRRSAISSCFSSVCRSLHCSSAEPEVNVDELEQIPLDTYASLVRQCGNGKALCQGKCLHAHITKAGYDQDKFIGNLLVQMYGKCGSLADAQSAFEKIRTPNVFSWTILISAYAQNGYLHEARNVFNSTPRKNAVAWTTMVAAYASHGQLADARSMFDNMPERDVVSWNAMIAAYAQNGYGKEAIQIFLLMDLEGIKASDITFISSLDACASLGDLQLGKLLHASIIDDLLQNSGIKVETALVNMYGKCGSVQDARTVFDDMLERNVVSWNAMISAYARNLHGKQALEIFQFMGLEGVKPDQVTFASVIDAYASAATVQEGKDFHANLESIGFQTDVVVVTALINMYGECGRLQDARKAFDEILQLDRDTVSWNAMIAAYSKNGYGKEALELFRLMNLEGVKADKVTFVSILDGCTNVAALAEGKAINASIEDSEFHSDVVVQTAAINMYGKCSSLEDARAMFDRMVHRDRVSWNAMIAVYAQNGYGKEAIEVFKLMDLEGVNADEGTFVSIIDACAGSVALKEGKGIHACIGDGTFHSDTAANGYVLQSQTKDKEGAEQDGRFGLLDACTKLTALEGSKNYLENTDMVSNALVNMYGKCGSLEDAKSMFDSMAERNLVSWNAMIAAYAQNGHAKEALETFHAIYLEGVKPDGITFLSLVDACAGLSAIEDSIINNGFQADLSVANALVNMHGKRGRVQDAKSMFDGIPEKSLISWNAMISAYAQNGHTKEAVETFCTMDLEGVQPDGITFISILEACGSRGAIEQGMIIDTTIADCGFDSEVVLGNALVNMYGKCGRAEDARQKFNKIPRRDVVSWNAMVGAYAQNGYGNEALEIFRLMDLEGMQPDEITFLGVLDGCSSLADLRQGKLIHGCIEDSSMETEVVRNALVNMYAKCGSLQDARSLFNGTQNRNIISWNAMVAAYAQFGHGNEARELSQIMELEGTRPNNLTFMSILCAYSHVGLLNEAWQYFISISADYGVESSMDHYVCLVDLLARLGKLEEAENLIDSMPYEPGYIAWTSLLAASRTHGDVTRGARAAETALAMNPERAAPYVLLSSIYAAASDEDTSNVQTEVGNEFHLYSEQVPLTNLLG